MKESPQALPSSLPRPGNSQAAEASAPPEKEQKEAKSSLRKLLRTLKATYSQQELENLSEPIISRLTAHPQLKAARTVLLYNSLPDEVSTHSLIRQLAAEGKSVLLPVVISDTEMELRRYTGQDDLHESAYGILEPTGKPFTAFSEIDFALIPGMAFDAEGNRLGRGKGYYDRFLHLLSRAYKIGICFPFQLLPHIPTDEHDRKVDEVLSVPTT
ncbi:MAG: 5-formyltetrahydrofolate cyclo-ligase [Prevotella sp.]|nr:5-formyltetrahydrofolate cyclo-ligase [Prevotella sp.]